MSAQKSGHVHSRKHWANMLKSQHILRMKSSRSTQSPTLNDRVHITVPRPGSALAQTSCCPGRIRQQASPLRDGTFGARRAGLSPGCPRARRAAAGWGRRAQPRRVVRAPSRGRWAAPRRRVGDRRGWGARHPPCPRGAAPHTGRSHAENPILIRIRNWIDLTRLIKSVKCY